MSGGSFNYLYTLRGEDLRAAREHVVAMRDEVLALAGPGLDAVVGAREVLALVDELLAEIDAPRAPDPVDALAERLGAPLRAVEWWRSGDTSRDPVDEALGQFSR